MKIDGCTALVTGANQGIGKGFIEVLLALGAARIYATARRPDTLGPLAALDGGRIVPLALDVTDPAQRGAAAAAAQDVTLLINNAGIAGSDEAAERRFLAARSLDDARLVMETDYWAPAELCRLFAPVIAANGGGAIVNVISIGALFCVPEYATYSAAKAALAMMTQGIRAELAGRNILVCGVFTGGVASRMSARNPNPVMSAEDHARQVLAAVEAGQEDIFAGARAEEIRDAVKEDPKGFERRMAARLRHDPLA